MMASSSRDIQQPIIGFASPQEEALLNLMRTADCLHRALQQRLKPSGLTSTQYNVLRILRGARPKGLTCSTIGRRMITPEPDITRLLARLKAQKFLTQHRDKDDKRVVWTCISPEGLAVLADLDPIVDQAPRDLLKALNRSELQEWTRLMKKVSACDADTHPDVLKPGDSANEKTKATAKPPSPRSSPLHPPLE